MKSVKGRLNDKVVKLLKIYFREVLLIQSTSAFAESEPASSLEKQERESEIYVLARGYMLSASKELRKMRELKQVGETVRDPVQRQQLEGQIIADIQKLRADEFKPSMVSLIKLHGMIGEVEANDDLFLDELAKTGRPGRSLRGLTFDSLREEVKVLLSKQTGEEDQEEPEETMEVHEKCKDAIDEMARALRAQEEKANEKPTDDDMIALAEERAKDRERFRAEHEATKAKAEEGKDKEKGRVRSPNPSIKIKKRWNTPRDESKPGVMSYGKPDRESNREYDEPGSDYGG